MDLYAIGWFTPPSKSFSLHPGTSSGAISSDSAGTPSSNSPSGIDGLDPHSSSGKTEISHADYDELVFVKGNDVVWQAGFSAHSSAKLKSFRQTLPPQQAILATFTGFSDVGLTGASTSSSSRGNINASSFSGQKCLCILQGFECVKVYAPDGAEFEISLPCKASGLWALPRGILIKRATGADTFTTEGQDPDGQDATEDLPRDQAESGGPMFFSLFHPLEELKPVSYTQELTHTVDASPRTRLRRDSDIKSYPTYTEPSDFMCDPNEEIILCSSEEQIVVTFHRARQSYSLWLMVPATALHAAEEAADANGSIGGDADGHESDGSMEGGTGSVGGKSGSFTPIKRPSSTHSQTSLHSTPRSTNSNSNKNNSPWDDVGSTSAGGGKMNRRINRILSREGNIDGADYWGAGLLPQQQQQDEEAKEEIHKQPFDYSNQSVASEEFGGRNGSIADVSNAFGLLSADEDGDDVIESELFFRCVWTEPAGSSPLGGISDTAVVSHDIDGTPLVTILTLRAKTAKILRVEKRFGTTVDDAASYATGDQFGNNNINESHDEQGSNVSQLLMLSIPSVRVTVLGRLDALAVQPVLATGTRLGHLDLIVLNPSKAPKDGQLALYRGQMRLCNLQLPTVLPPSPDRDKINQVDKKEDIIITGLAHAVSRRVNVVLSTNRAVRVSVPMLTQSSILTPVLAAFDETLSPSLSLRLRVDVAVWYAALLADQTNSALTRTLSDVAWKLVGGEGLAGTGLVDDMDLEWGAFLMLIARLVVLCGQNENRKIGVVHQEQQRPEPQGSWNELLSSGYHREYQGTFPLLLGSNAPQSQNNDKSKHNPDWYASLCQDADVVNTRLPNVTTDADEFVAATPLIVAAMHLVFENSRLSMLEWHLLKPLATCVLGLVNVNADAEEHTNANNSTPDRAWTVADEFKDQYFRVLGNNLQDLKFPNLPASNVEAKTKNEWSSPVNVHRWLLERASGRSRTKYSKDLADTNECLPGKPFPALASCGNIQRICCFFDILAGSPGDNATVLLSNSHKQSEDVDVDMSPVHDDQDIGSPFDPCASSHHQHTHTLEYWMSVHDFKARTRAERLVLAMVWSGFETKDLDCLPFGIQIPLREALNQCRKAPPARWPADAYVIVDREDIAALVLAPVPNVPKVWYEEDNPQQEGEIVPGSDDKQNTGDTHNTTNSQSVFQTPVLAAAVRGKSKARIKSSNHDNNNNNDSDDDEIMMNIDPDVVNAAWQTSSNFSARRESKTPAVKNSTPTMTGNSGISRSVITTAVTPMLSLWERRHPHGGANSDKGMTTSSAVEAAAQHLAVTGRRSPIANQNQNRFASSDVHAGETVMQGGMNGGAVLAGGGKARPSSSLKFGSINASLMSVADYAQLSASWSASVDSTESGGKRVDTMGIGNEAAISLEHGTATANTNVVQTGNPTTNAVAASAANLLARGMGGTGGALASASSDAKKKKNALRADPSGFRLLLRTSSLRFGSDRRLMEVCKVLRSSMPVRLIVERKPETTDHELVAQQQAKLLLLAHRSLALPVGRGMITMGTVQPLLTEELEVPALCLSGRIPPNSATVKLDVSGLSQADEYVNWSLFHNGVAAGLRLGQGQMTKPMTRTWVAYNKPSEPNHTHAGFLLAMGLQGHLAALNMADTYEYLAQGHDAMTVAMLLGMSAAKRGSMEPTVSKMLCLHIPSLLPPAFSELEVPATVQTAAILSVGLLYQGTAHRLMTEFLLAEIGRRPTSDRCFDRESFALSAGLALGMVTLGHGAIPNGLSGLSDLNLEDRLHRYMVGGVDASGSGGTTARNAPGGGNGSIGADANGIDPTKCSRIREGPNVNVNVTASGATLALALVFLKSGNESVASRLALPDTLFLLDYVRPDLLMLRVLARSLVLWDNVEPSLEWINEQVPEVVQIAFERLRVTRPGLSHHRSFDLGGGKQRRPRMRARAQSMEVVGSIPRTGARQRRRRPPGAGDQGTPPYNVDMTDNVASSPAGVVRANQRFSRLRRARTLSEGVGLGHGTEGELDDDDNSESGEFLRRRSSVAARDDDDDNDNGMDVDAKMNIGDNGDEDSDSSFGIDDIDEVLVGYGDIRDVSKKRPETEVDRLKLEERDMSMSSGGGARGGGTPVGSPHRRADQRGTPRGRSRSASEGRARRLPTSAASGGASVDEQSVKQAHANILAGACMSVGFRFMGTALQSARDALLVQVKYFRDLRAAKADARNSSSPLLAQLPDTSTLEMCLGAASLSLAMVMAGTGDLECFKLLRSLRWKIGNGVEYGHHMCIGMSIGLLFLGGGRVSLSDSNGSIAVLLAAFFPRFPTSTDDNQYHLQALRHLYVLATEKRAVEAYDVDTKAPCYVPLDITLRENVLALRRPGEGSVIRGARGVPGIPLHLQSAKTTIRVVSPDLLPPFRWIESIAIASPRYWPMKVQLMGEENAHVRHVLFLYRVLCVKRKAGHLSYWDDPRGLSSLLARPRPKLEHVEAAPLKRDGGNNNNNPSSESVDADADVSVDLLRSFTHDPVVLSFANHFCSKSAVDPMLCGLGGERLQLDLGTQFSRRNVSATDAVYNDPEVVRQENAPFAKFCTTMLYHCLINETPNMLTTLVDMFQAVKAAPRTQHSLYLENLKLLEEFYEGSVAQALGETGTLDVEADNAATVNVTSSTLVAKDFVTSLSSTVRTFFAKQGADTISRYLHTLDVPSSNRSASYSDDRLLHAMLCFYDVPSADVLVQCKNGKRAGTLTSAMLVGFVANHKQKQQEQHMKSEGTVGVDGADDVGISPRGLVSMLRALRQDKK